MLLLRKCVQLVQKTIQNGSFLTLLWGRWHCRLMQIECCRIPFDLFLDPRCTTAKLRGNTIAVRIFRQFQMCHVASQPWPPSQGRSHGANVWGWRLGQIGWEFSRSITNRSKIIQPSWGVSIVSSLQYFDILT